jgi:Ca-activated chloride channel family protein
MIHFAHPAFFWLLLLLPLVSLLKGRRGNAPALRYPNIREARAIGAQPVSRAGRVLPALRLAALVLLITGLARPQFGRGSTEIEASGIDILLAIDVSSSMEALDFEIKGEPVNRLAVVKQVVSRFVDERPNDRIGLVAFAGRPYLVSPLTLDHGWLQQRLESVSIGDVEDGTAIGSAIASSVNHLSDPSAKSRITILLTDGMNNAGKASPNTAAEAAETLGIKIYTIGAGTRGEAPIPVKDSFGRRRLAMAEVDIDEDTLSSIAQLTGGQYYRATDSDSLERIYGEINRLETTTRKLEKYQQVDELYLFALIPALLLLGGEFGLGETRFRRLP